MRLLAFIDRLLQGAASSPGSTLLQAIGTTEPRCPYCGGALEKMPGAKKKCPSCRNFIYVRTRPLDNKKVLLRDEDRELLDEQWAIANGSHAEYLAAKRHRSEVCQQLARKLGRPPAADELEWHLLEDELRTTARDGNWGLYRNAKLNMASIVRKRGDPAAALALLLEVCYLDLNGPRNCGGMGSDPRHGPHYRPFSAKEALLAPAVLGEVADLVADLHDDIEATRATFLEVAGRVFADLSLPIHPEKAWNRLARELSTA